MKADFQDLTNYLLKDSQNINIQNRLNSYQFKMSQNIFAARLKQGISREMAAKKAQVSYEDYLNYERGLNLLASKEKYNLILQRINNAN